MSESTQELTDKEKATKTIRDNTLFAMAVSIAPIPLIDIPVVGSIQYSMLSRLCQIYGVEFSKNRSRAIITALITSSTPMVLLGLASAAKIMPGLGTVIGSAGAITTSGAFTYALGQVIIKHFEQGGSLSTFNVKTAQDVFRNEMEKGKQFIDSEQAKQTQAELEPKPQTNN